MGVIRFFRSWAEATLIVLSVLIAVPLIAAIMLYSFVGWLVAVLLIGSNLPWYYAAGAFAAWVACAGLMVMEKDA